MAYETNRPLAPNVKGAPSYRPKRRIKAGEWKGKDWQQFEYDDAYVLMRVTYHNCPRFDGTDTPCLIDCVLITWEEAVCK